MEDYTKFSKKTEVAVEEVAEVEEVPVVEEVSIKTGIVSGCTKLNVRAEPYKDADVVCTVSVNAKLAIDESESTEDFYKICTVSGIEGFCMKQYITLE